MRSLIVGYLGNFGPEHSTENHVRSALIRNGHLVVPLQENTREAWSSVDGFDLILWTRTGWDWPHDTGWSLEEAHDAQRALLDQATARGVPVIGYHLDRWWGLNREPQIEVEPFFRVDLLVTADGGHAKQWADAGVNHRWMPPAVSLAECERVSRWSHGLASRVAFVGSWQGGYHAEWTHRPELVAHLRERWTREGLRFWPQPGMPAMRGQALADLYASVEVLVGDSCLVGDTYTGGRPLARYWSDRIPETLGRGGLLVHPEVEGLDEHFLPEVHLLTWTLGDFEELDHQVRWALDHPDDARAIARNGRAHVLEHHTYERRMEDLLAIAQQEGLL